MDTRQPKMHGIAFLWPGLSHLWNRGSWAGLVLAVGFTILLNVLLVASLVWTEWMTARARLIGFGALSVIWFLAWLESRADWRRYVAELTAGRAAEGPEGETPSERSDRLLGQAQQQYLAGDWVATEQLLRQLLKLEPDDVEARLMLATLWRHQGRDDEAARQLDRLERTEAAGPWCDEIAREKQQLGLKTTNAGTGNSRSNGAANRSTIRPKSEWPPNTVTHREWHIAKPAFDTPRTERRQEITLNGSVAMYERFTDRARKVMQLANQEAQRFNHEYIGTEHVLLGLIKEGSGVAANVLKNLDVDLRKIRLEVEKLVQSGPDMVTMGKLPQTPRAKKVIEYSMEEARHLSHNYVGTEHYPARPAAGAGRGVAAQVLMNLGLKLEDVRDEVPQSARPRPGR